MVEDLKNVLDRRGGLKINFNKTEYLDVGAQKPGGLIIGWQTQKKVPVFMYLDEYLIPWYKDETWEATENGTERIYHKRLKNYGA